MQNQSAACGARLRAALLGIVLSATTATAATAAMAADADSYPSRPLTIVVPSVAGNVNDAAARLIGQELTKTWNQPVIVENKPAPARPRAPSTWHARTRMAIPCC